MLQAVAAASSAEIELTRVESKHSRVVNNNLPLLLSLIVPETGTPTRKTEEFALHLPSLTIAVFSCLLVLFYKFIPACHPSYQPTTMAQVIHRVFIE